MAIIVESEKEVMAATVEAEETESLAKSATEGREMEKMVAEVLALCKIISEKGIRGENAKEEEEAKNIIIKELRVKSRAREKKLQDEHEARMEEAKAKWEALEEEKEGYCSSHQPPEKKPKLAASTGKYANYKFTMIEVVLSDDEEDDEYGYHNLRKDEYELYCRIVMESEGFDVPFFPKSEPAGLIIPMSFKDDDPCDFVNNLAKHAINDYNKDSENGQVEFVEVEKVNFQGVWGTDYYITLKAKDLSDGLIKTYQARLYVDSDDSIEVLLFRLKPTGSGAEKYNEA